MVFRVKLNYIAIQSINAVFFILAYLYLWENFADNGNDKMATIFILFPTLMCGAYVFYTNRIFYALAKPDEE